jgi:hypothetical protein
MAAARAHLIEMITANLVKFVTAFIGMDTFFGRFTLDFRHATVFFRHVSTVMLFLHAAVPLGITFMTVNFAIAICWLIIIVTICFFVAFVFHQRAPSYDFLWKTYYILCKLS